MGDHERVVVIARDGDERGVSLHASAVDPAALVACNTRVTRELIVIRWGDHPARSVDDERVAQR